MNINHLLDQTASERGVEVAMRLSAGEVTYAQFQEAVRRLARGLQSLGVNKGDRVAIMLPNLPQFPIAFYAVLRLGAVAVPVNMMYKGREASALLDDSEARILIAWRGVWDELARPISYLNSLKQIILLGENLPEGTTSLTRLISTHKPLADIVDLEDDDPAVIQYSAGAAGALKGAELSHGNLTSNVNACREVLRVTNQDLILATLPFFHPMGQTLLMHLGLLSGATLELQPRVDAVAMRDALRRGTVTVFVGVPSMFKLIADTTGEEDPAPEKPVRLCVCGGGAISEDTLKVFEKRFATYILECYTVSEASPVTSFNQWRAGRRVGSLGHPIPGVEMKVVDERGRETAIGEVGEIVIKGSNIMRRYLNRPRLTAETLIDGWFHTGDLGKMDINAFFYLVERLGDRILKGGFSIYPTEIECLLQCHPDVADVAVVGIPDEVWGESVKACVVLKEGATVTTEQLAAYCLERVAVYKVPSVIRFYKDLPRTSTGRIYRRDLKG